MRSLTHARPIASYVAAAAGLLGSIACSAAMVLPVLGIVSAGVAGAGASMAGMTKNSTQPAASGPLAGLLAALAQHGPAILVVSTLAITLAVALRRPLAAIPILAAGALLYWGMYLQPTLPAMYVSIVLGLAAWLAISAWLLVPRRTGRTYSDPN